MCATLSLTRVASSATARAAIATSKSSIRVPRRSSSALTTPNARLTSSVHCALGISSRNPRKRLSSRFRLFEAPSRAKPYSISDDDRLRQQHVGSGLRQQPFADGWVTGHRERQRVRVQHVLHNSGGPFRVRAAATAARRSSSSRRPSPSSLAAANSATKRRAPFGLGGQRPLQGPNDVAVPAHVELARPPIDRSKQTRRQMHGGAHDDWNTIPFTSRQPPGRYRVTRGRRAAASSPVARRCAAD